MLKNAESNAELKVGEISLLQTIFSLESIKKEVESVENFMRFWLIGLKLSWQVCGWSFCCSWRTLNLYILKCGYSDDHLRTPLDYTWKLCKNSEWPHFICLALFLLSSFIFFFYQSSIVYGSHCCVFFFKTNCL